MTASLIDLLRTARVYDLEQPRFAGMPIHPAHRPGYFYALHRRHDLTEDDALIETHAVRGLTASLSGEYAAARAVLVCGRRCLCRRLIRV